MSKNIAFSRANLVSVIFIALIVVLLVGILLPSLGKARKTARSMPYAYAPEQQAAPGSVGGQSPFQGGGRGGGGGQSPFQGGDGSPELPPAFAAASAGDEVWIIVPTGAGAAALGADDEPGCGAMIATLPGAVEPVPVPLRHTDVYAEISGFVAAVNVRQTFHNPFDTKIEAEYVFPLPQNAAINGFVMTIGERTVRGFVRAADEAEALYAEARAAGYTASLLSQERPNIFTQSVANIEPGRQIDVEISYFNSLAYADGWFEFVFPMVVGPRFNPPAIAGGGIGATPRDRRGTSGQRVEVPYLKPGERSGHDIALAVSIDAGVDIEGISCDTHRVATRQETDARTAVELAPGDAIPNKDFVLRFRVAGEQIRSAMIFAPNDEGEGGHFTMLLVPPLELTGLQRAPVEFVFVLDCSGSMSGEPLSLAKGAVRHALDRMTPRDTFQIIRFSEQASALGATPLPATGENIRKGRRFLDQLESGGGTMMIEGIRAALRFPHDVERTRYVTFLTDGYIGNEDEILVEMEREIGPSRVFSFGIGSSPNRFLIDRMARVGRGAVAYVTVGDDSAGVMGLFFDRVSHPALTDVAIDWGALDAYDIYPARVPDLFVGRPVVLSGRYRGEATDEANDPVVAHGRAGGTTATIDVGRSSVTAGASSGLAPIWARMKIADLSSSVWRGASATEVASAIEAVAFEHSLMSAHTSFVAIDSEVITEGDSGVTIPVPVPVPEGVRYETTVADIPR